VDVIASPSVPTAAGFVSQLPPTAAAALEADVCAVPAVDLELEAPGVEGLAVVVDELDAEVQAGVSRTTTAATARTIDGLVENFRRIWERLTSCFLARTAEQGLPVLGSAIGKPGISCGPVSFPWSLVG